MDHTELGPKRIKRAPSSKHYCYLLLSSKENKTYSLNQKDKEMEVPTNVRPGWQEQLKANLGLTERPHLN